ncbi:GNAT family N-acetyltransferase [Phyllobacterium sp. 22229]|uniref:GNAT family N-acetyltransferase n=1 Tax=Phyllobacterium sp. 22229 TaxID=3453895 RepID=UPI003F85A3B4
MSGRAGGIRTMLHRVDCFLTAAPQSRWHQLEALRALEPHLLRDIGLTPADIRRGKPEKHSLDNQLLAEKLSHLDSAAVRVRDAQDRDMEPVQAIYAYHVLNGIASFELEVPAAGEMAARRAAVLAAGLPYLVAEVNGEIAGYCYATPYRPRPAYRFTVEDSVYIANGMAGCGIGSLLLGELIRRCEAGNWRQMVAVIGDSGNTGSLRLHERLGFAPVGTLRAAGFKFGQWVDTVLMQRPLGQGDATFPA